MAKENEKKRKMKEPARISMADALANVVSRTAEESAAVQQQREEKRKRKEIVESQKSETAEAEEPEIINEKGKSHRASVSSKHSADNQSTATGGAGSSLGGGQIGKMSRIRKLWQEKEHVVPDVSSMSHERTLIKLATRGVVKLFNAVQKQQKVASGETSVADIPKNSFLSMLKGGKSAPAKTQGAAAKSSAAAKQPAWGVLRDDFLGGGGTKMRDWDKMQRDGDNLEGGNDVMDFSSDDE